MKEVDFWKDIQGFKGKYQVSYSGQIRRVYKSGKTKILAQFKKFGKARAIYRDRLLVHLVDDAGKDHTILVHQIVAKHFLGKPKQGQVPHHVNGCVMDNWASNLEYIDKRKLGELTGASSRRQPVVKLDSSGEIVDCYSSAREAGRQNFMSYQTITDRCNGKCKKAFAPDGFEYAWEEKQRSIDQAIRRIEMDRHEEDNNVIANIKQVKMKYAMEF
jgi:hypothetical protein